MTSVEGDHDVFLEDDESFFDFELGLFGGDVDAFETEVHGGH